MIAIGQNIPESTLFESIAFGDACPMPPVRVEVVEALKNKKVIIFALPGAYTPTCSAKHVPGYLEHLDDFKARGIDEIWCVSVNDGYVMAAWGRDLQAIGKIRMLGDGAGDFAKKLGLELDLSAAGLGLRIQRMSMFIDNGVVKQLNVEAPGKFETSDAATMLKQVS